MGLRFRKSIKMGPVRINLSKSGVGWSVGTKGARLTKKANGGYRTTVGVPGTGVSYVQDYSGKTQQTQRPAPPTPQSQTSPSASYDPHREPWEAEDDRKKKFSLLAHPVLLAIIAVICFTSLPHLIAMGYNATASKVSEDTLWYFSDLDVVEIPNQVRPGDPAVIKINGKPNTLYRCLVYVGNDEFLTGPAFQATETDFMGNAAWTWDIDATIEPGWYFAVIFDRAMTDIQAVDFAVLDSNGNLVGQPYEHDLSVFFPNNSGTPSADLSK